MSPEYDDVLENSLLNISEIDRSGPAEASPLNAVFLRVEVGCYLVPT